MTEYQYEVHCLDTGQATSTVLIIGGDDADRPDAIVIDLPKRPYATISCLRTHNVGRIRLVIISHSDDDHAAGLPDLVAAFPGRILFVAFNLDRWTINDKQSQDLIRWSIDEAFKNGLQGVDHAEAGISRVQAHLTGHRGGEPLGTILYPRQEDVLVASSTDKPNLACAVVMLTLNGVRVLLGSDLDLNGWSILYNRTCGDNPDGLKANVLSYPHHGAELKAHGVTVERLGETVPVLSPLELMRAIDPDIVVISVGTEQPPNYEHPRNSTFDMLAAFRKERRDAGRPTRLTCTGLTSRCIANPLSMRQDALAWQVGDGRDAAFAEYHEKSCPCGGTLSIGIDAEGNLSELYPASSHAAFVDRIQLAGDPGCRRAPV